MAFFVEIMNEIVEEIKTVLHIPVSFVPLPLSLNEKQAEEEGKLFFVKLSSAGYAIKIETGLTEREKRMAHIWIEQLVREREKMRQDEPVWMREALENWNKGKEISPFLPEESGVFNDETIYLPFIIQADRLSVTQKEGLTAYFEQEPHYFTFASFIRRKPFMGMLVPLSNSANIEERSYKDTVEEWARGLQIFWEEELGRQVVIGVFYPVTSPEEAVSSFGEMLRQYDTHASFYHTKFQHFLPLLVPWSYEPERLLFSLAADERESFIQTYIPEIEVIGELARENEWRKTMEAFFKQNLNISETARTLYIHRNTLQYRLDKIKGWTGLDPKVFEEAIIIRILLFLVDIRESVQDEQKRQ